MSYVIGVIVVVAAIVAYASLTGLPDNSGKARSHGRDTARPSSTVTSIGQRTAHML